MPDCASMVRTSDHDVSTHLRLIEFDSLRFSNFFSEPMLTIFRLGNMSSFPKILRETRLDEDKVILNRSCYAFRFSSQGYTTILHSIYDFCNEHLISPRTMPCQQPNRKKKPGIQETASVGQNNWCHWWQQIHEIPVDSGFQTYFAHTLA